MIKKAVIKKQFLHRLFWFVIIFFVFFGMGFLWRSKKITFKEFNNKFFNPINEKDKYLLLISYLSKKEIFPIYLNYIDDTTIEASLDSGIRVIFSLKKDIISSVTSLQLILARFRIEGRKINRIDLRFKNAIIE